MTTGRPTQHDLLMYEAARGGTDPAITSQAASSHVISAAREDAIFNHALNTSAVVPCFTPSWNTQVYTTTVTSTTFGAGFSVPAPSKGATIDYAITTGTREVVTAGSESKLITHNLNDPTAIVLVSVGWNTTIYRGVKSANSFTVSFGSPPFQDSYIYWSRQGSPNDVRDTDTVADGSETWAVQHQLNRAFLPAFFLPSWNTTISFVSKADPNETVIKFSTPPSGAGSLDWRVRYELETISSFDVGLFGDGEFGV